MSDEFVYDFPDDDGVSLAAVMSAFDHGAVSLPLGESLLGFSTANAAIMFRLAFGHIRPLAVSIFSVPDGECADCREWLFEEAHHIQGQWRHLETLSFGSRADQARFEVAYSQILSAPAAPLDLAFWPHIFGQ